jgi:3',5'-cyclic AMP phosphodiesterase CpdA
MRVAHFSDLHLLSLEGVPPRRFLNKRLSGWINLRLKRARAHHASTVRAVAREIARVGVDHVVVTGDLTNLALEPEFELALDVLERDLGLDPSRVTVVPGNHDLYTRGAHRVRRFEAYFSRWLESDLPDLAGGEAFPVVKLRRHVAFVALCSAVPRPPLVAAGEVGAAQLAALERVLAHPEVARRTVVLALHHPPTHHASRVNTHLHGLRDAPALLANLRGLSTGLVLHGHLHRRMQRVLPTPSGSILQVGATSASLHHDAPDRMAGFNLYDIPEPAGRTSVLAHVYSPPTGAFHAESVPRHV